MKEKLSITELLEIAKKIAEETATNPELTKQIKDKCKF